VFLCGSQPKKHTVVEAVVHRDLVRAGIWPKELGADYSDLVRARQQGDYGGALDLTPEDAAEAIRKARRILEAVHRLHPDVFAWPAASSEDKEADERQ
jgi:uncharacterized protein (UPF0332 family)